MSRRTLTFTINDLADAIGRRLGFNVSISRAWIGDINHQHKPKEYDLGPGAVLTVKVEWCEDEQTKP